MYTEEQLDQMSDARVLELAGGLGPGIIGKAHFDRAAAIRAVSDDGKLGPAIIDPDYAKKQAAKRLAEKQTRDAEPDRIEEEESAISQRSDAAAGDPWAYVTLSGAKMLAQQHNVSYQPRVKRDALIAALKHAGVEPPAPPADPDANDDFDELHG